ncbi:MarR family winged helix-turn-helix transcriptional regulator [Staphylococcus americanisciuri]|uniref:MarR family transcriptional regulator n=1 Tax=Staphylococcus americanisciuri TaxID=2973940 RepID=A0ABT2F0M8_9STAP|nr:MarR family transcriptional regulator [Staphylococcus americanisciuri]MCS4486010.1 MarR family transcriptional regulator [Staphylococcus americanisciuri]
MQLMHLFDHVTKLYRPYVKLIQPLLDAYQLHPAQWLILKDIHQHPETTLVQVSKRRSIEKPTARKILKVLDERGLLSIQPGQDKREKLLTLSIEGEAVYHELITDIQNKQIEIAATLPMTSAEVEQTMHLLDQLYRRMIAQVQQLES